VNDSPFPQAASPHCILIAEDNPDMRRLNAEILEGSGYRVDAASDGARAWDALQTKKYDLLITDYDMPRMSGMELVQKVREARMRLPVLMVSGTMPTAQLQEHGLLQVDATLPKPHAIMDLLNIVKKLLAAAVHAAA
jgi:two-component system, OmpR family, phosphate regulon response regulator PhoB